MTSSFGWRTPGPVSLCSEKRRSNVELWIIISQRGPNSPKNGRKVYTFAPPQVLLYISRDYDERGAPMMLHGSVDMMMKNAAQGVQTSLVGFARRNDGVPAGCVCGVACVCASVPQSCAPSTRMRSAPSGVPLSTMSSSPRTATGRTATRESLGPWTV